MRKRLVLLSIFYCLINWNSYGNELTPKNLIYHSKYTKESINDSLKKKFTKDISAFLNAYNTGDLELVCDMIYPKLFDFQPKEELIELMKRVEKNGMNIKSEFRDIERISSIVYNNNEMFCRIYYHISISVKLTGELFNRKNQIEQDIKKIYGKDNYAYDESNSSFLIEAKRSIIAISFKDSGIWKYLEYNKGDENAKHVLIPSEVLMKIGQ